MIGEPYAPARKRLVRAQQQGTLRRGTALSQTAKRTVEIVNRLGLHARPAMAFVDLASTFKCKVTLAKGSEAVDGKSIMELMMLAATKGTKLELTCAGDDAEPAAHALAKLVADGFEED